MSNDEYVYVSGTAMRSGQYKSVSMPAKEEHKQALVTHEVSDTKDLTTGTKSKKNN